MLTMVLEGKGFLLLESSPVDVKTSRGEHVGEAPDHHVSAVRQNRHADAVACRRGNWHNWLLQLQLQIFLGRNNKFGQVSRIEFYRTQVASLW